ncbi:uncharacterized protein CLUP02_01750 [Colletotrichum lupini]|uniref:Uncharacterized protein n=1 Tax=Colletotrichum lupini TaxID=145971 RepID=A0A9Q8WA01_9PEZI|nr:uncharacterized protein CLUP02_01750 [Colletotrichum lupini]UQC75097.1 hypothetical protein CLUP02_01750 [Colletotrichum lupini]
MSEASKDRTISQHLHEELGIGSLRLSKLTDMAVAACLWRKFEGKNSSNYFKMRLGEFGQPRHRYIVVKDKKRVGGSLLDTEYNKQEKRRKLCGTLNSIMAGQSDSPAEASRPADSSLLDNCDQIAPLRMNTTPHAWIFSSTGPSPRTIIRRLQRVSYVIERGKKPCCGFTKLQKDHGRHSSNGKVDPFRSRRAVGSLHAVGLGVLRVFFTLAPAVVWLGGATVPRGFTWVCFLRIPTKLNENAESARARPAPPALSYRPDIAAQTPQVLISALDDRPLRRRP